jgi:hypothetical protein
MSPRFVVHLLPGVLTACSGNFTPRLLSSTYSDNRVPDAPDYNLRNNWAALPDQADNADRVPGCKGCVDEQKHADADVFFIHPTLFLDSNETSNHWNADVEDEKINESVDKTTILYQASVFNGAGKIYAPRYRQAHLSAYYSKDSVGSAKALNVAYSDVRRAFQYYLDNWNNGRPIIIASHSQGTTHSIRLLQEFFDSKPLKNQLVAAYLIGIAVYDSLYKDLKACNDSSETGCYVTWRTYAQNYFPENYVRPSVNAVCTNPLSWKTDSQYVSREYNKGGILKNFDQVISKITDAQVLDGVVRINKPRFFLSPFFNYKNYHIVDYNLFYMNIRENARLRVKTFLEQNREKIEAGNETF